MSTAESLNNTLQDSPVVLDNPSEKKGVKTKELTPDVRGMIIGARRFGHTFGEISKKFNIPRSTVINTCKYEHLRVNNASNPRPGRPPVFSDRDKKAFLEAVQQNPNLTYEQLRQEMGISLGKRTLQRMVKEGYKA